MPSPRGADVVFVTGSESLVEQQGLTYRNLVRADPRLVVVRIRPSVNAKGALPDLELLVAARTGVPTQINSHDGGPAFPDLQVANAGAALTATVGALAGLYEREATGVGGWAETSLVDGVQTILPMIIGRVDHPSATTNLLWRDQGPAEALSYRCADGEYVQLWFGAKGAYEAFLDHVGDPPSEQGYNADLMSGAMVERGARWAELFVTRDRDWWLEDLAGHDFRCEPVWQPGRGACRDTHVREVGLAVTHDGVTVLGPAITVTAVRGADAVRVRRARPAARGCAGARSLGLPRRADHAARARGARRGRGEGRAAHRRRAPEHGTDVRGRPTRQARGRPRHESTRRPHAFSSGCSVGATWCTTTRESGSPNGSDTTKRRHEPRTPTSSTASRAGSATPGPALLPTNDQLMQALSGIEAGQGGAEQSPTYLVWGSVDVTGGWLAACGVLAGLFARRRRGGGQSVRSSLLGAALTLKSGAFLSGNDVVSGPVLDGDQRGYGAAYRLYQGADAAWFALAVPDDATWERLRTVVADDALPASPPPLRTDGALQPAEPLLEAAFAAKAADVWVAALRAADVPVEPVADADRTAFVSGFVDDPLNRQLGRVVSYPWGERGLLEQPGFALRLGPAPRPAAPAHIPTLGQHTDEFLESLGFDADARAQRSRRRARSRVDAPLHRDAVQVGSMTTRIVPDARSPATRKASAASSMGKRCVMSAPGISGSSASIAAASSISRPPS